MTDADLVRSHHHRARPRLAHRPLPPTRRRPPRRPPHTSSTPITSIYRWDGAVHETTEARAFLRSRFDLLDDLTAYVVERHPYEVPNVTAIPIVGGNPDYLAWVRAETAERESTP